MISQANRTESQWGHLLPIALIAGVMLTAPCSASDASAIELKAKHELKVSGDVAGMIHVQPDHHPVVGEIAQIWIALSQRGGKPIPLSGCDCRMTLRNLSSATPVLNPILLPISLEGYTDVPSATLRFTQSGRYQVQLTGKPQRGYSFTPFTLEFEVNVAGS